MPGETIRLQPIDGVWETLGADRYRGIGAKGLRVTSDEWGPASFSIQLAATDPGAIRPDVQPFTPIEVEVDGVLVFAGRTIQRPADDRGYTVTAQGWQFHLDDDVLERVYALTDLTRFRDMRDETTTTIGETAFCGDGVVNVSTGGLVLTWADGLVVDAGAKLGAFLDFGPDATCWPTAIAFDYESSNDNNGAPAIRCDVSSGNVASGSVPNYLAQFALTTWGASGSSNYTTLGGSYRYVFFWLTNPGGGTHTMVGDAWFKVKGFRAFTSNSYHSGGASALKASQVIADVLSRAPLLNQTTAKITTGSFTIPEYATNGSESLRSVIEAVNAYEGWQLRISGHDLKTLEARAKPTSPAFEVGEWSAASIEDASVDGSQVYNSVRVEGSDPAGMPVRVRRTLANLSVVQWGPSSKAPQPTNPSADASTTAWTVTAGSFTRDTGTFLSTPASFLLGTTGGGAAPDNIYTDVTSDDWAPIAYRVTVHLRKTASMPGTDVFTITALQTGFGGDGFASGSATIDGATLSSSAWTALSFSFVPRVKGGTVRITVSVSTTAGAGTGLVYMDDLVVQPIHASLIDRRRFARTKVLPIRSAITSTVGQRFGDLWLADNVTLPFVSTITVPDGESVRVAWNGAPIQPHELTLHAGERLRLSHRIDPDTGAVGRSGRIAAVSYDHDTRTAQVQLDDRPFAFDVILARFGLLTDRLPSLNS